jgi:hypothetical protein
MQRGQVNNTDTHSEYALSIIVDSSTKYFVTVKMEWLLRLYGNNEHFCVVHQYIYANNYKKWTILCSYGKDGYANAPRYIVARSLTVSYLGAELCSSSQRTICSSQRTICSSHRTICTCSCSTRLYFLKYTSNKYMRSFFGAFFDMADVLLNGT